MSQTDASDKLQIKKKYYIGKDPPQSTVARRCHSQAYRQIVVKHTKAMGEINLARLTMGICKCNHARAV